jgi:hypothetical protein
MPTKPRHRALTPRQRLQLATPMPRNQKSLLRTILRRKQMQLFQSVPPVRKQTPPFRRTASEFRWGFPDSEEFSLGAVEGVDLEYGIDTQRKYGKPTGFARVDVKPSLIPDSGNGTFALQDIDNGKCVTQYWGTIRSETEADEKKLEVFSFKSFTILYLNT